MQESKRLDGVIKRELVLAKQSQKVKNGLIAPAFRKDVKNETIIELYEAGFSAYGIGKIVGLSTEGVKGRLKKLNMWVPKKGGRRKKTVNNQPKRTNFSDDTIGVLYKAGYNDEQIATRLGLENSEIIKRLKRMNLWNNEKVLKEIEDRQKKQQKKELSETTMIELYKAGFGTTKISKLFGWSTEYIRKKLIQAGVYEGKR